MYFPERVHEKKLKKKIWKGLLHVKQLLEGLFVLFCFALFCFFSFLNPHAILSASIISHSHLDCFDLHENRALKFKNLYNFCI